MSENHSSQQVEIGIVGRGFWASLTAKFLAQNADVEFYWWVPHFAPRESTLLQSVGEVPRKVGREDRKLGKKQVRIEFPRELEFSGEGLSSLGPQALERIRSLFQSLGLSLGFSELNPKEFLGKEQGERDFDGFGSEPPMFAKLYQFSLNRERVWVSRESCELIPEEKIIEETPQQMIAQERVRTAAGFVVQRDFFRLNSLKLGPGGQGLLIQFDEDPVVWVKKLVLVGEPFPIKSKLPKEMFSGKSYLQWQKQASPSLVRLRYDRGAAHFSWPNKLVFFPAMSKKEISFFARFRQGQIEVVSFIDDETLEDSHRLAQGMKQIRKSLEKSGISLADSQEKVLIQPLMVPLEFLPDQLWRQFAAKQFFWLDGDFWSGQVFARNCQSFLACFQQNLA